MVPSSAVKSALNKRKIDSRNFFHAGVVHHHLKNTSKIGQNLADAFSRISPFVPQKQVLTLHNLVPKRDGEKISDQKI